MTRAGTALRRTALVLVALVLAVLAAEGALRAWLAARGEPWSAARARERLELPLRAMTDPVPWASEKPPELLEVRELHAAHPFHGWQEPWRRDQIVREAERQARGELDDATVVVIVGGSVAALLATEGRTELLRALAAEPRLAGREFVVLNHAAAGFKQPQQVGLVSTMILLGLVPDVVVNVDGFNEVALANDNAALGASPVFPHWPRWAHVASSRLESPELVAVKAEILATQDAARALASGFAGNAGLRSALLGSATLRRMTRLSRRWSALQTRATELLGAAAPEDDPARGPTFDPDPEAVLDLIERTWEESSLSIHALCAARGIRYAHVLQPTLFDEGSKPLTGEERARANASESLREGTRRGYPRLRAAGARLAARGVLFHDASRAFAELRETTYFDLCHFRGPGTALFAEHVAAAVADALAAPAREGVPEPAREPVRESG